MSYLFVIDCEMSGPSMMKNGIVNIGAVLMRTEQHELISSKDIILNLPEGRNWDTNTKQWFESNPILCKIMNLVDMKKGKSVEEGMREFYDFLVECFQNYGENNIAIVSDHIDIDAGWINMYLSFIDISPLHLITGRVKHLTDISSFHRGVANVTHQKVQEFETHKNQHFHHQESVLQYLNISTRSSQQYTHSAVDDATHIGDTHCLVLNAIKQNERNSKVIQISALSECTQPTSQEMFLNYIHPTGTPLRQKFSSASSRIDESHSSSFSSTDRAHLSSSNQNYKSNLTDPNNNNNHPDLTTQKRNIYDPNQMTLVNSSQTYASIVSRNVSPSNKKSSPHTTYSKVYTNSNRNSLSPRSNNNNNNNISQINQYTKAYKPMSNRTENMYFLHPQQQAQPFLFYPQNMMDPKNQYDLLDPHPYYLCPNPAFQVQSKIYYPSQQQEQYNPYPLYPSSNYQDTKTQSTQLNQNKEEFYKPNPPVDSLLINSHNDVLSQL